MRFPRAIARTVVLAGLVLLAGCGALRHVNYEANRARDEDEMLATGPDALRDLLGEPDEWTQEDVKGQLQITAVWYCVDKRYREVVWRSRIAEGGRQYWAVVSDVTEDCRTPDAR